MTITNRFVLLNKAHHRVIADALKKGTDFCHWLLMPCWYLCENWEGMLRRKETGHYDSFCWFKRMTFRAVFVPHAAPGATDTKIRWLNGSPQGSDSLVVTWESDGFVVLGESSGCRNVSREKLEPCWKCCLPSLVWGRWSGFPEEYISSHWEASILLIAFSMTFTQKEELHSPLDFFFFS